LFHRKPHTDPLRMWAKKLIAWLEKSPSHSRRRLGPEDRQPFGGASIFWIGAIIDLEPIGQRQFSGWLDILDAKNSRPRSRGFLALPRPLPRRKVESWPGREAGGFLSWALTN
jgi:hypothetical protein